MGPRRWPVDGRTGRAGRLDTLDTVLCAKITPSPQSPPARKGAAIRAKRRGNPCHWPARMTDRGDVGKRRLWMDIRISAYPDNRIYGYPLIRCGGAVRLVLQALPCWLGHGRKRGSRRGAEEEKRRGGGAHGGAAALLPHQFPKTRPSDGDRACGSASPLCASLLPLRLCVNHPNARVPHHPTHRPKGTAHARSHCPESQMDHRG